MPRGAEKHVVVISREWHEPEIKLDVIDTEGAPFNGIAISITLPDYVKALGAELGDPAQFATAAELQAGLEAAMDTVCEKMKRHTVRVM